MLPRTPGRSLVRLLACLLLAGAAAACDDEPTGPLHEPRIAGGRAWVAIAPPEGLPDAGGWLPYLPAGSPSEVEIRRLLDQAATARRRGSLREAEEAEREAARAAIRALARAPDAITLLRASAALDAWTRDAEAALGSGAELPELAAGLRHVREARASARGALADADSIGAARHLSEAALTAREQAPEVVALRVLERASALVEETELDEREAARARRLLRFAREAISGGDAERAYRRAVYALQLASGHLADAVQAPRRTR